jgi:maltooligosyltrehalose trehalohydrolase
VHLVLENDRNESRLLERSPSGDPRIATAQWNDDVHHTLHVVTTARPTATTRTMPTRRSRSSDARSPKGFVFQGEPSAFRGGSREGNRAATCRRRRSFRSCRRTTRSATARSASGCTRSPSRRASVLRSRAFCLRRSPDAVHGRGVRRLDAVLFFCDFGAELAAAVREGRRAEFAPSRHSAIRPRASAFPTRRTRNVRCFQAALGRARAHSACRAARAGTRADRLEAQHIVPRLAGTRGCGRPEIVDGVLCVSWTMGDGALLRLVAQFGSATATLPSLPEGETLWLDPGRVHVLLQVHD